MRVPKRLGVGHGLGLVWLTLGASAATSRAADPWTLERVVAHAEENSPDARIAEQRIAAARAGLAQADAAFRPLLQLQSSYTRTDNPMQVFGAILAQREYSPALDFNDVPDLDDLNVRGVVTMPLYSGGSLDAGREAAAAEAESAAFRAAAVRSALAFEAARTFYTVLEAREFVRAAEAGVHAFETSKEIARNRFEVGTALKTELLDMELQLARAREELVRARNASALAVSALRSLLGVEEEFVVADSAPETSVPAEDALSDRPELAAAREAQHSAEARVREVRSGRLPRVNAVGILEYDRGTVTGGDGKSYTAGVMAQWDLWDGRRTDGRVAEAEARLAGTREEERKLRLALALEIEQARLRLAEAEERLGVLAASVALAEESVEISRARFEEGLALSGQLIDAETALTAARVHRAEAEGDRRIAIAALRKALGLPQVDSRP